MSITHLKKALNLFSSTTSTLQSVKRNINDNIYQGLGITQALFIFIITSCWIGIMFPENGFSPIDRIYSLLHNATRDEISSPETSDTILDYILWLAGTILSIHIGNRMGKLAWGTHCLIRTRCRSHHTMDLPLTSQQHERVRNSLLPLIHRHGSPTDQHTLKKKVDDMREWVNSALLFYTAQKHYDKKQGKIESARNWWAIKKRFRKDFNAISLYQHLHKLHDNLQQQKDILTRITHSISNLSFNNTDATQDNLIDLITEALQHFERNTNLVITPHKPHQADITYRAINNLLNKLIHKKASIKDTAKQLNAILKRETNTLTEKQNNIPLGPLWLQNALSYTMSDYYQKQAKQLTLRHINVIASILCHINSNHIPVLLSELTKLFSSQTEHQILNIKGEQGSFISERGLSPEHRINSRNSLLEMDSVNITIDQSQGSIDDNQSRRNTL